MKASLIISVYKDVDSLNAILVSLSKQSEKNFEIIVSQDSDFDCFNILIAKFKELNIQLIQQKDDGFQKNKILNKAIQLASTDKLIFIDGDCVLHPKFIAQYCKNIQKGIASFGRRVDLDSKTSSELLAGKYSTPSLFILLKNKAMRAEESLFMPWFPTKILRKQSAIGCNMGWHKNDLLKLNGFDESYTTPGFGEDTDIEFRAKIAGITFKNMRWKAIQFHLDHPRIEREEQVLKSKKIYQTNVQKGVFWVSNGIKKGNDNRESIK